MFELDHDLAQDIVDRAMAILPYNVNVMDSQGLILGSGEAERINTRHEGAQLVLANGRIVELDNDAAKCLKGVQPGVNLPLMLDGRLIGVLGLTGLGGRFGLFSRESLLLVNNVLFSVLAQLLLMRRKLENWYCWLLVNSLAVPLFASRELYLTAFIYGLFWCNAWYGLYRWRRELNLQTA